MVFDFQVAAASLQPSRGLSLLGTGRRLWGVRVDGLGDYAKLSIKVEYTSAVVV